MEPRGVIITHTQAIWEDTQKLIWGNNITIGQKKCDYVLSILALYAAITTFIVFQTDIWRLHGLYAMLIVLQHKQELHDIL